MHALVDLWQSFREKLLPDTKELSVAICIRVSMNVNLCECVANNMVRVIRGMDARILSVGPNMRALYWCILCVVSTGDV